jgi:hypothetical protein
MIVIKSRQLPEAMRQAELMEFLDDLKGYDDKTLRSCMKVLFLIMQADRMTRDERKCMIGHIGWMLENRKKAAATKDIEVDIEIDTGMNDGAL